MVLRRRIQEQIPKFDLLTQRPAGKVPGAQGSALVGQENLPPRKQQEVLWKQFFADTTQWWDNRQSKLSTKHPDFRHKASKAPLWLDSPHKPVWVDLQLATVDAGVKTNPERWCTAVAASEPFAAVEDPEVVKCRRLIDSGLLHEAVDTLGRLVERGCHLSRNLFYRVLKGCIQDKDLALGKRIHALTVKSGYEGDPFLSTHLMGFYAKNGNLKDALAVFTQVPTPNAHNWSAIISAYTRQGEPAEASQAIRLYRQMCMATTVKPDVRLQAAVLKACATAKDLVVGKEVHAQIVASSGKPDRYVQAGLVNMYVKCGSLEAARQVFDEFPNPDVVTWTSMIAGYAQEGMGKEAIALYRSGQREGLIPDRVTYGALLQACASEGVGGLDDGKQLHAEIKDRRLHEDVVLGGSLVNMYAKCRSLADARSVFDSLPNRSVVACNALLSGYSQQGMGQEALSLYRNMQQEGFSRSNRVTYVCLLQACASVGVEALDLGMQLHAKIKDQGLQEDVVVSTSLINMYAKCGSLDDARHIFARLRRRDIVAWNAMIGGYAQKGMGQEALGLYRSMQHDGLAPDCVTYTCLLQACASVGLGALEDGKQLNAQIKERGLQVDVVLGGSLVNMYAKCGSLEDARRLFDALPEKNVVAWTAMIAGYTKHGMSQEALNLHKCMQQDGIAPPDCVTYVCLLQACANVGVAALSEGKQLHLQIKKQGLQDNVVVGGSLVNMYAKCGGIEDARSVFDELPERSMVAWTAMLGGYAKQGMGKDALGLYSRMQQEGVTPDSVAYVCLLQACAAVAGLPLGQQLHAEIERRGLQADPFVGAALVHMYAKCGSMYDSQRVFDSLSERSSEAWNAVIFGYARQGDSSLVFALVDRMRSEGVNPDGITFLSVLTACSHVGLLEKGREYFKAMKTDYGISETVDHYICMVDLLGRAGHLDEALEMVKTMPFPANDMVWKTLLAACKKWKNVDIAEQAFKGAVAVDETNAASHVLMANIYANARMWDAAEEMQARRKKLGAGKQPGQSWWTDMSGVVHTFLVGDKTHPESEGIYARLKQLVPRMKKEGYEPHLPSSLLDGPDDEKEANLCGHSEKLAIAYALNKTPEGTTIRIVKNLRVCEDCHIATGYISKVENRTIICRDASRFHVFAEGKCSCGDYW